MLSASQAGRQGKRCHLLKVSPFPRPPGPPGTGSWTKSRRLRAPIPGEENFVTLYTKKGAHRVTSSHVESRPVTSSHDTTPRRLHRGPGRASSAPATRRCVRSFIRPPKDRSAQLCKASEAPLRCEGTFSSWTSAMLRRSSKAPPRGQTGAAALPETVNRVNETFPVSSCWLPP